MNQLNQFNLKNKNLQIHLIFKNSLSSVLKNEAVADHEVLLNLCLKKNQPRKFRRQISKQPIQFLLVHFSLIQTRNRRQTLNVSDSRHLSSRTTLISHTPLSLSSYQVKRKKLLNLSKVLLTNQTPWISCWH